MGLFSVFLYLSPSSVWISNRMMSSRSPLRHTTTLPLSHHRKCCGLAPSEASTSPAQFYISKCRAEVLNLWVVTPLRVTQPFPQESPKTIRKHIFLLPFSWLLLFSKEALVAPQQESLSTCSIPSLISLPPSSPD